MAFDALLSEIRGGMGEVLSAMGAPAVDHAVAPARPGFGDASCNAAFLLARELGKSPAEIAAVIAEEYRGREMRLVASVEAHPSGYVNFAADWPRLSGEILRESRLAGYGEGAGGPAVVVEHTSVNPNKALHIGHVRNIVIGDAVSRILRRAGHRVSVLNYVDDSGLQVAEVIVGFRRLGLPEEPPGGKKFDRYCGDDVYVRAAEACERDPAMREARQEVLRGMEDGGSETAAFADRITRRILACQLETCWRLGVTYDCLNFESQIVRSGMWAEAFEKLKEQGLVELEDDESSDNLGCWVVRVAGERDKVIVRSDGTATYVAKDIPYAAWKLGLVGDPFSYSEYPGQPGPRRLWQTSLGGGGSGPDLAGERVITVIDSRQALLQRIVSSMMSRFKSSPDAYVHLGYESVKLSPETAAALGLETGGKKASMSGRRGLYVGADAVYDMLRERAAGEARGRNPGMDGGEIGRVAHAVAVGTLRYEMIRQDLDKMIVFDLERSLSLEGDTAPYIQYTHARASRILERAGRAPPDGADWALLSAPHEIALVREIGMLGAHVDDAARNLSPKVVARHCHDLAVLFNSFYEKSKVLDAGDAALEDARLCLVESFRSALGLALGLLGIEAPARM